MSGNKLVCILIAALSTLASGCYAANEEELEEFFNRNLDSYWQLTEPEKQRILAILSEKEREGYFEADPGALERSRFLLGDRKARDEVLRKFREQALGGFPDWGFLRIIAISSDIEIVPEIAKLLRNEERKPSAGHVFSASPAGCAAFVIPGILSRSPELPPDVISWARSFSGYHVAHRLKLVQDWWAKNEQAFQEKRYKDVVPGEPVPPYGAPASEVIERPAESQIDTKADVTPTPAQAAQAMQRGNGDAFALAAAAAICLAIAGWLLWRWLKPSKQIRH